MPPDSETRRDTSRNTTPCPASPTRLNALRRCSRDSRDDHSHFIGIIADSSGNRPIRAVGAVALRSCRRRAALAEPSTSAAIASLNAGKRLRIERAEEQIVEARISCADAIELQPAGRRDAEQHAAAVERIGALQQKACAERACRFRTR